MVCVGCAGLSLFVSGVSGVLVTKCLGSVVWHRVLTPLYNINSATLSLASYGRQSMRVQSASAAGAAAQAAAPSPATSSSWPRASPWTCPRRIRALQHGCPATHAYAGSKHCTCSMLSRLLICWLSRWGLLRSSSAPASLTLSNDDVLAAGVITPAALRRAACRGGMLCFLPADDACFGPLAAMLMAKGTADAGILASYGARAYLASRSPRTVSLQEALLLLLSSGMSLRSSCDGRRRGWLAADGR